MKNTINTICVIILIILFLESDWKFDFPSISKPDTVAVVYESSETIPEPYVTGALRTLTGEGLQARAFDKDVVTGTGETPVYLAKAIKAAKDNGLPALVIMSSGDVIKVQDLPKTQQEILEAAK